MIILDATTKKLQLVLSAPHTTSDSAWIMSAVNINSVTPTYTPIEADGVSNGTTAVDVCAAPSGSDQRQVKFFSLVNTDTAAITLLLRYNNNGTTRDFAKATLQIGDTFQYVDNEGCRVLDSNGNIKMTGTFPFGVQARGTATTAMSDGTTTLTNASTRQQLFTGSGTTAQTVILPAATTLAFTGWEFEIDNTTTGSGAITVQTNGGATLFVVNPGVCAIFDCTSITTGAGTWDYDVFSVVMPSAKSIIANDNLTIPVNAAGAFLNNDGAGTVQYGRPPQLFSRIDIFGHSYFDVSFGLNSTSPFISANQNQIGGTLAGLAAGNHSNVVNHAVIGANLVSQGKSPSGTGTGGGGGGWARVLNDITRPGIRAPFAKYGNLALICYGINDVGNFAAGSQATMRTNFQRCLNAIISRWRASAIYPAKTGAPWVFGANFSAATAVTIESSTGQTMATSVVDSAGSSTATFTIPAGYQGEPICFLMLIDNSANTSIVTWGGNITGTTGIIGTTTTLSGIASDSHDPLLVRWTAATNGLSKNNAGQTISVRMTTSTGPGNFTLDSAWIESFKPNPILICNVPKPVCANKLFYFGDGVTSGVNTSFTSGSANFSTTAPNSDNGIAITETDAQGAFTAGKTITVTNSTTAVLSGNATGAFTSIKFSLNRIVNGYAQPYYTTNADFSGATVGSHASADTDVNNLNAAITAVVASWDSMVGLVDLDTAIGSDANLPANIYTWFAVDGMHLNDWGLEVFYKLIVNAANALRPVTDNISTGILEQSSTGTYLYLPERRPVVNGLFYGPEFTVYGSAYSAVAGDVFALPFMVTEPTCQLANFYCEVTNTPTTGSSVRYGIYDDVNFTGRPQVLRFEATNAAAKSCGTGAAVLSTACTIFIKPGLYWLVLKMDTIVATAPQWRTITGPNKYMPNQAAAGGANTYIAWKYTGVGVGAFPANALTFGASPTLASTAPVLWVQLNTF
jgi:hypothetical protein